MAPTAVILANTKTNINLCAQHILANQLAAFATETVYGLGGNATSDVAIKLIYATKKRPTSNPLIVHFSSINQIEEHCEINDIFLQLAVSFMPGPISVVLNKKKYSSISGLCCANNKIAVRIPNKTLALELIKTCGVPIAAPSANMANMLSPTSAMHVKLSLENHLLSNLLILNGGSANLGIESTVVEIVDNEVNILRNGYITKENLEHAGFTVTNNAKNNYSPGMLYKHYSPNTKLIINCKVKDIKPGMSLLAFGEVYKDVPTNIKVLNLSKSGNLKEAAKNFFNMLWQLDLLQSTSIAVMPIPNNNLGLSINEKLNKASA